MSDIPVANAVKSRVSLRNNPVLRREMVERLRGFKGVLLVTLPLILLTGVLVLAYTGSAAVSSGFSVDVTELGRVGRGVFEWVLTTMLALLLFMVPGLTAGSITGERERQTLVPLQMTMMSPMNIIIGKLSAALAFLTLLIVASIPLLAVSFLVGGLAVLDIVRGIAMVIFTGVVLGAVCIYISSRMKRTATATVVCYGLSFVFAFGGFALMIVLFIIGEVTGNLDAPPAELLSLNPFTALGDALPRSVGNFGDDTLSPLGGTRSIVRGIESERANDFGGDFEENVWIWQIYLVVGVLVLFASVRSAAKSITTPAETER